ncbi:MAG: putative rane protein [Herbinix sp.]|jgi:uncharacterized membrane protein YsdA (DUF1294 family)|nr:putative rane protein [Herbinix sp.]
MNQILAAILMGYLVLMSLVGFAMMGVDKRKAIKKAWRIPERTLLITAFVGGGIGSFLGMYAFRHKTKHAKFIVLFPVAAALYVYLLYRLYELI